METLMQLVGQTGKSVINMVLYTLVPIMVIMMALMRGLEEKRVIQKLAQWFSPVLLLFGLPGLGAFAMLQITLISFAAPLATLGLMETDLQIPNRSLAATLAVIFALPQANGMFPLAAVGLNIPLTILCGIGGALLAAAVTYFFFAKTSGESKLKKHHEPEIDSSREKRSFFSALLSGGEEGLNMALKTIPMLILALFLVNILRYFGAIKGLEAVLDPILKNIGLSGASVLPVATKYLAGGTAMMGVTMEQVSSGALSVVELNRIAGFMIHPLDLIGAFFYASVGPRTAKVVKPAIKGALIGILFRGLLHMIFF